MFPPRPSWPAEETRTELVLVGSKFGAGALPGIRNASSRKFRPLRGSRSMALEADHALHDRRHVAHGEGVRGDVHALRARGRLQAERDLGVLSDLQGERRELALREPVAGTRTT